MKHSISSDIAELSPPRHCLARGQHVCGTKHDDLELPDPCLPPDAEPLELGYHGSHPSTCRESWLEKADAGLEDPAAAILTLQLELFRREGRKRHRRLDDLLYTVVEGNGLQRRAEHRDFSV